MPASKLKQYLDERHVKYLIIQHSPAYTAQGTAARMHIHGWELAKTTILKVDGSYVMAVLPAPAHVDLDKFQKVAGKHAALATESEFQGLFPGCDLGAMPPFGNLYGLRVYLDERLAKDPSIVFNAGTHSEAIRMDLADLMRLVEPVVASFARG